MTFFKRGRAYRGLEGYINLHSIYWLCYSYSTGLEIYGSKQARVQGFIPRTRTIYVAINPWQPCYNLYIPPDCHVYHSLHA